MKFIVGSKKDEASVNIMESLKKMGFSAKENLDSIKTYQLRDQVLLESEKELIYFDNVEELIRENYDLNLECVVFVSRHASDSGIPTLTTHVTGNLEDENKFGGDPESLAVPMPAKMRILLEEMKDSVDRKDLDYDVSYEVTHHGPTELGVPSLFLEIGSTESRWKDENAGDIVSGSLIKALESDRSFKTVLGVGDGHYAPRHTDEAFSRGIAYGHIIPEYMDPKKSVIEDAIEKSSKSLNEIIVHSNRTPNNLKEKVLGIAENKGIPIKEI